MKNKFVLFTVLLIISQYCFSENKVSSPLIINSRLELFVDSFLIESLNNLQLRMQIPVDEGPVMLFDKPWEGQFSAYSTVIKDSNIYRLYYRGLPTPEEEGLDKEVTCYAESADGIHWTKPQLKLFKIKDTWDNNVILANSLYTQHNFSPFLDNSSLNPFNGKFKALAGLTNGLIAFCSDDGIHWKKLSEISVLTGEPFDSQNISFWSESEKCYLCYSRKWIENNGKIMRSVGRSTSADFLNWSSLVAMDFGNKPEEEIYTNQTGPYFRAPHIYIALATRFFEGKQIISDNEALKLNVNPDYYKDCSDAVLITSRGGTSYQRTFMEGFLRPGIGLNNWISRTNYPALNVVQTGETEMSFYVNQDYAQPTAHLHRYSLRIDGFASLHAGYFPGEMTTNPLIFTGSRLVMNFSTSAAGYIVVEILDNQGNVISDFSSENCIPLVGNEISRQVEWKSGLSLNKVNDTPVRILFKMKDADLYSIRFE